MVGLMMIYHGTIRQKKITFNKSNISLPMKIGCFNAPKGNDCIIPTIHFQVLLLMDKIRRSPVDKHFMYHYLQGIYTSQVVVWEFFHQQHVSSREDNFQKEENSTSHRPSRFHRPVFLVIKEWKQASHAIIGFCTMAQKSMYGLVSTLALFFMHDASS